MVGWVTTIVSRHAHGHHVTIQHDRGEVRPIPSHQRSSVTIENRIRLQVLQYEHRILQPVQPPCARFGNRVLRRAMLALAVIRLARSGGANVGRVAAAAVQAAIGAASPATSFRQPAATSTPPGGTRCWRPFGITPARCRRLAGVGMNTSHYQYRVLVR